MRWSGAYICNLRNKAIFKEQSGSGEDQMHGEALVCKEEQEEWKGSSLLTNQEVADWQLLLSCFYGLHGIKVCCSSEAESADHLPIL
ncbi:hypothetical protein FRX31_016714 [Thalictrum thalictroides]|uniref:Uncharacterized protein n=1 Tax=Thalictrum thalictroides TaxID=46969 RepID=A0A7J6WAR6_THATH|nr:hypothetical protein FRX31_016714 [Thalictrum thalictroides]